jgi:hypothetical protein
VSDGESERRMCRLACLRPGGLSSRVTTYRRGLRP